MSGSPDPQKEHTKKNYVFFNGKRVSHPRHRIQSWGPTLLPTWTPLTEYSEQLNLKHTDHVACKELEAAAATFSLRAWRGSPPWLPTCSPRRAELSTAVLSCTLLAFVLEHVCVSGFCAAVFTERPEHIHLLTQWIESHYIKNKCTTKVNTTMITAVPKHARTHLPLYIWPCGRGLSWHHGLLMVPEGISPTHSVLLALLGQLRVQLLGLP